MENNTNNTSPTQAQNTTSARGAQASKTALGESSQQATPDKGGLSEITDKLEQLCSATAEKVGSLSTIQKVVGGSVLALGAGWIAMNAMNKKEKMRENVRKRN